ncbi:MAG: ferrous iron transporter B [Candidatus Bathyarchaeota archaeon]|jgi:ferrous iron transport protein B|nr:ferrous iron transporter B [Candidatus Bathyarchaeota archaeon]MDP7442797.1 ferrous iron transporter B [Candidatus Bathyarchaeota archaeon]
MSNKIEITYDPRVEKALKEIGSLLHGDYQLSKRIISLLLLQNDTDIKDLVKSQEAERWDAIQDIINQTAALYNHSMNYVIAMTRRVEAKRIVREVTTYPESEVISRREHLSRLMMNPVTGLPIFVFVIYVMYQFVGNFGAQIVVDYLETSIFEEKINPFIITHFTRLLPWSIVSDLFVGDYGIFTLGVRYAIALILPIVGTYFIAFGIMEDSGYLPRMAMLIDRVFKSIGLNGRAVIPMVLGFGCDTMATIVTRTLETKRERVIATLLLSLAIPCSAQLGVIFAILAGAPNGLLIWGVVVFGLFLLVGFLSARLMPGEMPTFHMEIPPLRVPKFNNVAIKTLTRMEWYFREVFPMFIIASILIWLGQISGVFDLLVGILAYPVSWIGLPREVAVIFLFGFFRRDYGAAGLFDLHQEGLLANPQLIIAAVTLTLFLPCIAQIAVNIKERGSRMAAYITLFVFPFAFLVGYLLKIAFMIAGVPM